MIWLWVATALISAGAAALIVQRAASGARRDDGGSAELAVYRRQMAEIEDLADRGLIAEGERRTVRAETGRRLLAAANRTQAPLRAAGPGVILAAAAIAPMLALAAYVAIGAPGFADQPFARRLAVWRAADPSSLTAPQMAAVLRQVSAERPADPEPLRELAVAELASNQPNEALQALNRAIALAPQRGDLWEMLGEMTMVQAGEVNGDALAAFRKAAALDPTAASARYYIARTRIAGGDVAGGLADWKALQAIIQPGDPRKSALASEIAEVSATGKLPPDTPQPEASPAIGGPQIQGMVDGLAAQLQANPDDPRGWVRLVRALTVLGETGRREAALAAARHRYAGDAAELTALAAAAQPQTQP